MGRRRGADAPLVDGNYDPRYRAAKLEHYGKLGYARSRAACLRALERFSSFSFVTPAGRKGVVIAVVDELIDAGCIALVQAGAQNLGTGVPSYRSRDVDLLAARGFQVVSRTISDLLVPMEARQVRGHANLLDAWEQLATELLHRLCEASALALVQAGVDEENERDTAEREQKQRAAVERSQRVESGNKKPGRRVR